MFSLRQTNGWISLYHDRRIVFPFSFPFLFLFPASSSFEISKRASTGFEHLPPWNGSSWGSLMAGFSRLRLHLPINGWHSPFHFLFLFSSFFPPTSTSNSNLQPATYNLQPVLQTYLGEEGISPSTRWLCCCVSTLD
ncbi:hypothetical protein BKA65DRAFT_192329 [Rhexocercosporidium sp. MPI-PUGE-AT-0058]|nr:hypothetical protein BKA65DRAFT_192329 [Rhexocercosporidium sp. MPI-PUGE-AT-0058]